MTNIQKIADSLQSYTPVIQFGAVSGMWHVTFADWTDEVYTGKTILQALRAAQQSVHLTGGIQPPSQSESTSEQLPLDEADTTPPASR